MTSLPEALDATCRGPPNSGMALPRRSARVPGLFFLTLATAALPAAGCSPTSRDFGTGGGSTSSGGTGGAGGAGGGTSVSTSTSGTGGSLPVVCGPGMDPWAGPLCGPPSLPCKVIVDETLPSDPTTRNGPPSIALDPSCSPQILFQNNLGAQNGFHALRTAPNTWTVAPTPFPIVSSGFAVLDDGTPLALGNDALVWQKPKGGIWSSGALFNTADLSNADGFAREPSGALHVAAYNSKDNSAYYGHLAAGASVWTVKGLGLMVSGVFPLALSAAGDPHLAFWSSSGGAGWSLYWAAPPGVAEVATPLGSNLLDSGAQQHKLVVTAPDVGNPSGRPHVLFVRALGGSSLYHELVTVERVKQSSWITTQLDQENPSGKLCSGAAAAGQMCNFDYEQIGTLGAVVSKGGDLRFVYAKIHHVGVSVGTCTPNPPILCFWSTQTDNKTGQIRAAWLDQNGMPVTAAMADGVFPSGGRVVLDTIGHLHLAVLDSGPPAKSGNTSVRYLEIGP